MASGLLWLLIGSVLAFVASFKLHTPEFLTDWSWLTFGRVRAAHLGSVGLGWSSLSGIGVGIWLMCRLSRAELIYPRMLYVAAAIWNVGLVLGVGGILAGYGQSIEWLDFPPVAPPLLVLGLGMVSAWTLAVFRNRREKHVYVTQWYIFGAMFWFPWLYTTAAIVCVYAMATGVVQATTNWWFAHNVLGLWITPIGVGAAYYLIPKVIGRPVYSYYLSIVGFWTLALFYSWAGMHHLVGGPIPTWMSTASTVGSMMMLIPVAAVGLNHHMTMKGHFKELKYSPTLRFVVFGAMAYTAVSVQGAIEALKKWNEVTHFTHYTVGHAHLGLYGFYAMTMFGSMYYIVPRLTQREWASPLLIRIHFWCAAVGITIYFVGLSIGGWMQGLANLDANVPFIKIVQSTVPFLMSRTLAAILLTTGHVVFAVSLVMNLAGVGPRRTGRPTYFVERVPVRPGVHAEAVVPSRVDSRRGGGRIRCAGRVRDRLRKRRTRPPAGGDDMDRGMVLFIGCLLTFTSSWLGLVFAPEFQLGKQQPVVADEAAGTTYPRPATGQVLEGREVYRQNGCIYCHTQQIASETFRDNSDIKRGWGTRRTVARDYIYEKPVMLGTMRTGPDLANVGLRWYEELEPQAPVQPAHDGPRLGDAGLPVPVREAEARRRNVAGRGDAGRPVVGRPDRGRRRGGQAGLRDRADGQGQGAGGLPDVARPHVGDAAGGQGMSATSPDPATHPSHAAEANVQQMHKPLNREYADPTDGFEPVPFWMYLGFGMLLFWGGYYMSTNSAGYSPDNFDKPYPGHDAPVARAGRDPDRPDQDQGGGRADLRQLLPGLPPGRRQRLARPAAAIPAAEQLELGGRRGLQGRPAEPDSAVGVARDRHGDRRQGQGHGHLQRPDAELGRAIQGLADRGRADAHPVGVGQQGGAGDGKAGGRGAGEGAAGAQGVHDASGAAGHRRRPGSGPGRRRREGRSARGEGRAPAAKDAAPAAKDKEAAPMPKEVTPKDKDKT